MSNIEFPTTLAQAPALIQVRKLVADAGDASRTKIGQFVYARFGFSMATASRSSPVACRPCALQTPPVRSTCPRPATTASVAARDPCTVPSPPVDLSDRVDRVQYLELLEVRDPHQHRVWNELWRWKAVELRDPDRRGAAVPLNLVHVREENAPEAVELLEWFLLTSLPVQTRQDAERMLEWYRLRWRIEDWHRVLKSGYKVKYLAHRRGERTERAVTINAVIAWPLAAMTLMGRDTPELPPETFFSEIEITALEDFAKDRRLEPPDNLGRAVRTLAMLGGYLNFKRKWYAQPGHKVMWEGYTRLAAIRQAFERARRLNESSALYQKLRPDKGTCV